MDREYYINMRDKFLPSELRLVIIAESPPDSGKYFYDPSGKASEPLFRAIMRDILDISPREKGEGLSAFRERGMFLVDASYQPVNKGLSKKERNKIIQMSYPSLKAGLQRIIGDKDIPILIIKANVCEILEPLLVQDNYRVLNAGRKLPFPSSGQQGRFRKMVKDILWKT